MDADHESILLIKQEVFVYKIPPAGSNRKHRYGVKVTQIKSICPNGLAMELAFCERV